MSRGLLALIVGAVILSLGGCGLAIGLVVDRGIHEAKKESNRHAITLEEFEAARPGTPRGVIEGRLGDPLSTDERRGLDCIYYTHHDSLFNRYELCFSPITDRLVTKRD
jgi:hypothetical protein